MYIILYFLANTYWFAKSENQQLHLHTTNFTQCINYISCTIVIYRLGH